MIQLEIEPEVEQRIVEAARARGVEPSVYASKIVSDAVAYTLPKHLTDEEVRASLDRLASYGKDLPKLSEDAYSRESIYQDHD